jgi:hypothetical protein
MAGSLLSNDFSAARDRHNFSKSETTVLSGQSVSRDIAIADEAIGW